MEPEDEESVRHRLEEAGASQSDGVLGLLVEEDWRGITEGGAVVAACIHIARVLVGKSRETDRLGIVESLHWEGERVRFEVSPMLRTESELEQQGTSLRGHTRTEVILRQSSVSVTLVGEMVDLSQLNSGAVGRSVPPFCAVTVFRH